MSSKSKKRNSFLFKKWSKRNLLHIVNKLNRLFTSFGLQQCKSDLKLSITIIEKCLRWTTCEGRPGLKRFKSYSWCFTRKVMGISEPLPFGTIHRRHFNKCVKKASASDLSRLYWVSIFNVHRLITLKPEYDTSTITSRFKGSLLRLARYSRSLYTVTKSFSLRYNLGEYWSAEWKWHISGASGPNGSVAYTRYLDDLYAIRQEGLYWKIRLLLYSLPLSNRRETFESLEDAIKDSDFYQKHQNSDKQLIHSRLAFLSDKSGKTRVIAIGDILSQSCLKVVHQRCTRILRRLNCDGTFDQDKQRRRVQRWTEDKNIHLSSIDLSAATDRLPVIYQLLVIIGTRILTPLQALAWLFVITKRSFLVKYPNKEPKYIRYAVGQPMGMLSSWPVMAISHHILVQWAYNLQYPENDSSFFEGYAILGDDLVIADELVGKRYLELISALGVDYSPEKSFFSRNQAEFAKSLFCLGKDLTPFPLGALDFEKNTFVSNIQVILSECLRMKLKTDMSTITGITPVRWRNLAYLTALSPLSPKSVLDLHSRKDYGIFFSFVLIKRLKYFSKLKTVRLSTHAFVWGGPGISDKALSSPYKALSSPYLQIGLDNGVSYPVRCLREDDRLINPVPMLGHGWISYCTLAWPNGLPLLGDKNMVPGPTFEREFDDVVIRSSFQALEKLLPGYFTVRCVGNQVGEYDV